MLTASLENHASELPFSESDNELLRSNIPEYTFVGFACATSARHSVTLTLGLVAGLPYPESRPVRVLMARDECRDLAIALGRLAQLPHGLTSEPSPCRDQ